MVMVRVDAMTKRFGETPALTDLSVEVADGEFFVMVGPSGCGKTTLLRILAGLERPDSGEVWFGDRRVTTTDPGSREVGMVFQNYALYPHLSVQENLAFGLRVRHTNRNEIRTRVAEVAALLELQDYLDRKPKQLSGGQRQRVALGRAIMGRPQLLLMDEPLSNLDAILRERMRFELRRFHDRLGITTIYVTHDQKEAVSMADRVMVMNNGRIEQIGPPADIIRHPLTEFAARFMGHPPMNIWRAAMEVTGAGVARVSDGSGSGWTVPGPWSTAPGTSLDVWLGVRPRDVDLAAPGEVADLTATVEVVERGGGDDVFLHCRHRDETLVVSVNDGRTLPRSGDEVRLKLRLDRVHLFKADTGARIHPSTVNGHGDATLAPFLVGSELQ